MRRWRYWSAAWIGTPHIGIEALVPPRGRVMPRAREAVSASSKNIS
jgi:hypothetical protein